MIYLDLFIGFLKVGLFAFGGAYGAIPLIRDIVLSYGWLTDEALTYMIAVSESTPGPIMVNLATYVGSSQAGFFGAVLSTTAVVLPSFIIIIVVMSVFKTAIKNKYVQAVLRGLKPCIIGIILSTGIYMMASNVFPVIKGGGEIVNLRSAAGMAVLGITMYAYKKVFKKKMSSITLIIVSAFVGMIIFAI